MIDFVGSTIHQLSSSPLFISMWFPNLNPCFVNPQVQCDFVDIIHEHFSSNGLVVKSLEFAFKQEHIMDFTRMRALESLFSMIHQGIRNVLQYNQQHPDFPMEVSVDIFLILELPRYN